MLRLDREVGQGRRLGLQHSHARALRPGVSYCFPRGDVRSELAAVSGHTGASPRRLRDCGHSRAAHCPPRKDVPAGRVVGGEGPPAGRVRRDAVCRGGRVHVQDGRRARGRSVPLRTLCQCLSMPGLHQGVGAFSCRIRLGREAYRDGVARGKDKDQGFQAAKIDMSIVMCPAS